MDSPPEHSHSISLDEVDVWIESDAQPTELPDTTSGPVEEAIASFVTPYIEEGATLQTGIGGIPNAVVGVLAKAGGGDYGIHSEMFTTGLMHLHQAGKVSNRKGVFDGVSFDDLRRWDLALSMTGSMARRRFDFCRLRS